MRGNADKDFSLPFLVAEVVRLRNSFIANARILTNPATKILNGVGWVGFEVEATAAHPACGHLLPRGGEGLSVHFHLNPHLATMRTLQRLDSLSLYE